MNANETRDDNGYANVHREHDDGSKPKHQCDTPRGSEFQKNRRGAATAPDSTTELGSQEEAIDVIASVA